jgi:hypothetical protein
MILPAIGVPTLPDPPKTATEPLPLPVVPAAAVVIPAAAPVEPPTLAEPALSKPSPAVIPAKAEVPAPPAVSFDLPSIESAAKPGKPTPPPAVPPMPVAAKPTAPVVKPVAAELPAPPSFEAPKPAPADLAPPKPTEPVAAPSAPAPVTESVPARVSSVKYRILLRVGEGEPMFEVRSGDDLVMKVMCEKVDVKSPTEKGQSLSAVKAMGKVRFVGFGAEGVCDELSFMAGSGEVQLMGAVKVQVKDKLGRVESELVADKMHYRLDAAAMPGTLRP